MQTGMKVLLCSVAVSLVCSCADKSAHRFSREVREDGVELIVNSGGPKYAEPLYEPEETLSLGGEEPEPKLFQPGNDSPLVDVEGSIFITDGDHVKKFNSDGNFVAYITRPGQGPGELFYPRLLRMMQDTIVVDQWQYSGKKNYYLYRTDGTYLGNTSFEQVKDAPSDGRWSTIEQLVNVKTAFFSSLMQWEEGVKQMHRMVWGLINNEGRLIRDLGIDTGPAWLGLSFKTGRQLISFSRPFTQESIYNCNDDCIYVLNSEGSQLDIFRVSGTLERIIRLNRPFPKVSHAEMETKISNINKRDNVFTVSSRHLSNTKPIACGVVYADDGCFWLKKGEYIQNWGAKEPIEYMILDKNGEYIADQVLPIALQVVKGGCAYGFCTNEDGVKIFKRIRLVKK
ncbi:hypothetical protein JXO52_07440 [bacterium]|nr:hypothetical protein [bacterium]